MNALLTREFLKKQAGSSDAAAKQRTPSPQASSNDASSTTSQQLETFLRLRKRKAASLQSDHSGAKQKPQKVKAAPAIETPPQAEVEIEDKAPHGPSIYEKYTSHVALVGQGPNNIAAGVLRNLPSDVDADFLSSLEWVDLLRRTCSSLTEGVLYAGELVYRSNCLRTKARKGIKKRKAAYTQLKTAAKEAQRAHAQELREVKTQADELLKKKEEELQELKKKHEVELQKLRKELESSQAEKAQVHKDLEEAQVKLTEGASSFKDEFLRSQEFFEICSVKAFSYLKIGFNGAVDQFRANGYPPEGASTDFISLADFVHSLPPDS